MEISKFGISYSRLPCSGSMTVLWGGVDSVGDCIYYDKLFTVIM